MSPCFDTWLADTELSPCLLTGETGSVPLEAIGARAARDDGAWGLETGIGTGIGETSFAASGADLGCAWAVAGDWRLGGIGEALAECDGEPEASDAKPDPPVSSSSCPSFSWPAGATVRTSLGAAGSGLCGRFLEGADFGVLRR